MAASFIDRRQEGHRFLAPDHGYWVVYEVSDRIGENEVRRSLIFVSDAGFRRVRDFPEDWRTLDDAALWALSWRA